MKINNTLKKLVIVAGVVVTFGVVGVGCAKSEPTTTEPATTAAESETADPFSLGGIDVPIATEAPTVAVIESEGNSYVGKTDNGETQYGYGKYGPLGEEVYEGIAKDWVSRTISTKSDLQAIMDATYGTLSTKDELTRDILALTRNPLPTQPAPSESLPATQSGSASESQPTHPKESQPTKQSSSTNESQSNTSSNNPTKGNAESQQSQPTTENQESKDYGLIPGTDIKSTGDPERDAFIKEQQQGVHQDDPNKIPAHDDTGDNYVDQGKGLQWN